MDLPNIFSHSTELDVKLHICTIMTDTTIQSMLVRSSSHGAKILHRSPVLVYSDEQTAIIKMDESLQELGEESEKINEVIFALDPGWLQNGDVVSTKKPFLQKLLKELALRPVGFVILSEALVQHSINHNPHFSAVLLLLNQAQITVTVATQGKIVSTQTVGRSNDIGADLREAFARYLQDKGEAHLPGKLICASFALTEEELISCQQKLLDTVWGDAVPFVQTPTIDVIKPELAITIISQQVSQAVTAVAQPTLESNQSLPVPEHPKASAHANVTPSSDNFGFAPVAVQHARDMQERAVEVTHQALPTSFGIPITQKMMDGTEETEEDVELAVEESEPPASHKKSFFARLLHVEGKHHYNPKVFMGVGFAAGLTVLLVTGFIWLYYFSTVQISYSLVPKPIAKEISLTLDPAATQPDSEKLIIPAQKVSVDVTQKSEGTTTGIKIVGEKAVGEVTIFNKTDSQKTFPAGTVIAQDKLQFVTDKEVTVEASKENDTGTGKAYGESKVSVTAYLIGVEGNIDKDIELSVASFDKTSYAAKTTAPFTGGTSREIRVVSKEDRELLLSEAKKALLAEAAKQLEEKSVDGLYILPTNELGITKAVYSAELEAASEDLNLTLTGTVTALAYKAADLVPIAQAILSDQVPSGYSLSKDDPEILSAPAPTSRDAKAVTLQANVTSMAVPLVDAQTLKTELAGMPVSGALENLQSKKVLANVKLTFSPTLAQKIVGHLPSSTERISIVEQE